MAVTIITPQNREEYPDAGSTRIPHGVVLLDGKEVANTLQCVHCGCHWVVRRGSGIKRGWCTNCSGPHCGKKDCCTCLPFEKWLETVEHNATRFLRLGV